MKKQNIIIFSMLLSIAFFAIIGFGVNSSSSENSKELQLLHVIVRHGARTPADTFPKDPYINETFYPVGWGQLTNKGKLDLYNFGKYMRERYNNFFGKNYSPNEFYCQATDVDRTIASLQTINAGLWEPSDEQKWGPLNWQPIPIHTEPLETDHLLLVRRPCAQYSLEVSNVINSKIIQEELKKHEKLFEDLSNLSGKKMASFDDIQDIFSTLQAEESYGLELSKEIKAFYPEKLIKPSSFSYILNSYNDKLKRLKGGVFLKKLLKDWSNKKNGNLAMKSFLYGGHDSTIVNLLRSLNVWDEQFPNYGIAIFLEFSLDKITNQYGIEVFLKNSTTLDPFQLTIPNCDTFCPLDKLIELTKSVIPVKWIEECRSDDSNYVPPPPGGP